MLPLARFGFAPLSIQRSSSPLQPNSTAPSRIVAGHAASTFFSTCFHFFRFCFSFLYVFLFFPSCCCRFSGQVEPIATAFWFFFYFYFGGHLNVASVFGFWFGFGSGFWIWFRFWFWFYFGFCFCFSFGFLPLRRCLTVLAGLRLWFCSANWGFICEGRQRQSELVVVSHGIYSSWNRWIPMRLVQNKRSNWIELCTFPSLSYEIDVYSNCNRLWMSKALVFF